MEHWLPSDHLCGKYAMSRWRYLRWWLAAFVVSLLSFLSLWLPALFEGDGAVGCAGYGPLPSGLTRLWSVLEVMWLDVRQEIAGTHGRYLVLNGAPMVSVLLSGLVAAWSKRWLGTVVGLLGALVVAGVALHWAFMAFSYWLMLSCGGWEGRLPWMMWRLLLMVGFGSVVVLLIGGVRVRGAALATHARS
ncbi:hypothetical protein ACIBF7_37475 [Nonomuraea sp. NPDC050478]|uniref:hypothetical protein n=1 Tax=Nonomuraea sp. NPDC050478 TaxID=3364365 RepID=UPI0037BAD0D9